MRWEWDEINKFLFHVVVREGNYRGCPDSFASRSEGSHLLRHSLAADLLRRSASLLEIGQVLRHSQSATTQIYAKVDIATLRQIGQPWPGVSS